MYKDTFLASLHGVLETIQNPRFFENERGYQGELLALLHQSLKEAKFDGDPIIEQEYQKRINAHGIKIRPDLIIHIPFQENRNTSRSEGNFVAIELKRDKADIESAFENLRLLKEHLQYPLTIFIIIDSDKTYAELCPPSIASQTIDLLQKSEGFPWNPRCDSMLKGKEPLQHGKV